MSIQRPLEGITVIELATYVAAPATGRLLAEWGADVIRVEELSGDVWRFYGRNCKCVVKDDENPVFDLYNGNKRDIQLDIKSEEGRKILFELLDRADVFLTNNRLRSLNKLQLDYDSLKDRYPRLIYALITGYGLNGPDVDLPGFDGVAFFSRGGYLTGLAEPSGYPTLNAGAVGDTTAGTTLFGAICAALFARERTGKGDFVEVSLFGTSVWVGALLNTTSQDRYGNEYPKKRGTMAPLNTFYRSRSGEWLQLAELKIEEKLPIICEVLGIPEVAQDPRFSTAKEFNLHRPEITKLLEDAFANYDFDYISSEFTKRGIIFDRLRYFREIGNDPQAIANGYVREVTWGDGSKFNLAMPPIRSRNIGEMPYRRGPLMGEQTVDILKELGYSEDEILQLEEDHIVKSHKE